MTSRLGPSDYVAVDMRISMSKGGKEVIPLQSDPSACFRAVMSTQSTVRSRTPTTRTPSLP